MYARMKKELCFIKNKLSPDLDDSFEAEQLQASQNSPINRKSAHRHQQQQQQQQQQQPQEHQIEIRHQPMYHSSSQSPVVQVSVCGELCGMCSRYPCDLDRAWRPETHVLSSVLSTFNIHRPLCVMIDTPPANTTRSPNVGLALGQRRRRWTNAKPTLGERVTLLGFYQAILSGEG